ncbi:MULTISPECIES: hypothetical protein [Paenisporosarcina]|uniref:hypothetical protein n=1 Tax=Paenisporosarcina TaxID=651660 RepID=UPI00031CF86E|nr:MULTISPECIES: hypothetical protein [Paenisporosarcina]
MNETHDEKQPKNQPVNAQIQQPEKLSKEEKEILQVRDGQHNHNVDERGGF